MQGQGLGYGTYPNAVLHASEPQKLHGDERKSIVALGWSKLGRMQGPIGCGAGPTAPGRAQHPTAQPVSFSMGRWRLLKSHLESRLSDSMGRACRPHRAQALLHTVCLAGGI